MEIVNFILANSSTFLFVLVRTGAILLLAPVFGTFMVPAQVKTGLIVLLSLILTPIVPPTPMPQTFIGLAVSLSGEILIGGLIGLVIRFIFTGVEFAGQIASFQMGLGMASAYDPMHSAEVTVIGRLIGILTLLIFLSMNGHLMLIMVLGKSFETIPPYGFSLNGALMENFIQFSREIFVLGLKFSAPVIAILIFANISMGILARAVPQLNMFVVGFAITIIVGFFVIGMSLPAFETAAMAAFDRMWPGVFNLMRSMANG